ncbi:MAG: hypothetical protein IKS77_02825, partial [Spirochaetales bacterium]|nr:hypothetical protein [Spirochaetales bacterium]
MLLALIIALIAVLALDSTGIIDLDDMFSASRKSNYVQYTVLSDAIDSGSVTEAVIEPQSVRFSTSAGTFVTDNPDSGDLKEKLLQSGAKVTVKSGVSVTAVLDVIFDVLFFGAVAFGIFKLIDYSRKTFKVVHGTGVH